MVYCTGEDEEDKVEGTAQIGNKGKQQGNLKYPGTDAKSLIQLPSFYGLITVWYQ